MRWIVYCAPAVMLLIASGCPKPPPPKEPPRGESHVVVEEETPVEQSLRAALTELQRKNLDGAQVALNRVLIGHPEHLETRVLQTMLLTARGQRAEADAVWNEIERVLVYQGKLAPFGLQETLEAAALHYVALDRSDRARLFLDELWRRFPTGDVTARAQLRAAELEAAAQRWGRAMQRCGELIRIRPGHSAAERCRRLSAAARRMLELGPEPASRAPAWIWENPLPQGNTLHDVWAMPQGEVFAVGDAGTIVRRGAGQRGFASVGSPTRWSLRGLWGADNGELWAAGAAGLILHFDGRGWRVARPAQPEQADLWGIYASSGQVVAVGEGGVAVSRNGQGWSVQKLHQTTLRAIWGDGERLLAAGEGGTLLQRTGTSWKTLPSDCYEDLWSIWGVRPGPVVLVGSRRTVVQLDGERAKESLAGRTNFRDVWGAGAKELWAVGTSGDIAHYRLGKWSSENSGTLLDLNGIAGRAPRSGQGSPDEVWAVGEGGTILQRRGGRWSTLSAGVRQDLVALSAGGGGHALSQRGLLLRRYKGHWSQEASLPAGRYRDLWSDGARQIAVGDRGLLVVRNGKGQWQVITTDVTDDLTSVAGYQGGAVAVGTGGTLLRLAGERVVKESSPTGLDLRAVWAGSPRQIIAVGHRGVILRFDGNSWKEQDSGTLQDLLAVWSPENGAAVVVGANGTLLQQEGSHWRASSTPLQQALVDIWGSSPRNIYAVSDRGSIIHFDGQSWQVQRSPTSCLSAVHGERAGKGVWAAGCHGTIISLSPVQAERSAARSSR